MSIVGGVRVRRWLVGARHDLVERHPGGEQGVAELVHVIHQEAYVAHVIKPFDEYFFGVVSSYVRAQVGQRIQHNSRQREAGLSQSR